MAEKNPVAFLNEYCQKNKLIPCYEKYNESGQSHCKQLTMRLRISKNGHLQHVEFFGTGSSLKDSKNNAALNALKTDLVDELRKLYISDNARPMTSTRNNSASKNSDNLPKTSVDKLAVEICKIQFKSEQLDPIYECWSKAKQLHIQFNIDFKSMKKGFSKEQVHIKITMGCKKYSGKGETDLQAMYFAAKEINLDEFSASSKISLSDDSSSEDDSSTKVGQLNELHQQLGKELQFIDLAPMLGPSHNPLFLIKCQFGDLITYGLGNKKRTAKSKAASRMLAEMNQTVQPENLETQISNMDKWHDNKILERIKLALNSPGNAISVLEEVDKLRLERTLKFTETQKQLGIQIHFTVDCKLLLMPDLKLDQTKLTDVVKKGALTYLKTSSRSTKKKNAKTEAAEMMVNLLRGYGAVTHKRLEENEQLKAFERELDVKQDVFDKSALSKTVQSILASLIDKANEFLSDKPNYNADYDFLAEIQDMEFEHRDILKLNVCSSNEIYSKFNNLDYRVTTKVVINLICGFVLSAYAECVDELEAKNKASYEILKKLAEIKTL